MSFIRSKEIPPGSGNWYDYEVMTIHVGNKVIQKHIRYVGKSGVSRGGSLSRKGKEASTSLEAAPPSPDSE